MSKVFTPSSGNDPHAASPIDGHAKPSSNWVLAAPIVLHRMAESVFVLGTASVPPKVQQVFGPEELIASLRRVERIPVGQSLEDGSSGISIEIIRLLSSIGAVDELEPAIDRPSDVGGAAQVRLGVCVDGQTDAARLLAATEHAIESLLRTLGPDVPFEVQIRLEIANGVLPLRTARTLLDMGGSSSLLAETSASVRWLAILAAGGDVDALAAILDAHPHLTLLLRVQPQPSTKDNTAETDIAAAIADLRMLASHGFLVPALLNVSLCSKSLLADARRLCAANENSGIWIEPEVLATGASNVYTSEEAGDLDQVIRNVVELTVLLGPTIQRCEPWNSAFVNAVLPHRLRHNLWSRSYHKALGAEDVDATRSNDPQDAATKTQATTFADVRDWVESHCGCDKCPVQHICDRCVDRASTIATALSSDQRHQAMHIADEACMFRRIVLPILLDNLCAGSLGNRVTSGVKAVFEEGQLRYEPLPNLAHAQTIQREVVETQGEQAINLVKSGSDAL